MSRLRSLWRLWRLRHVQREIEVAEVGRGTPGWDAGYRAGFQDGNSDIVADWEAALDGLDLEAFPTVVAAEIRRLREMVEKR